jgi:DNA replicative helicase MCM subunit Mcm2 (Cdc46/Mcm family)
LEEEKAMEKTEIKIKIDKSVYDKAKEYDINLDEFLNTELIKRVNEISDRIAQERFNKEFLEFEREKDIIKIIKRISKVSKFKYASKDSIIAESVTQGMWKPEVEDTLDRLVKKRDIYQPAKSNYKVSKVKPKI